MTPKIDASITVLWQNLIALNASLAKENEEKREQLISTENMLQEEIEKTKILRAKMEEQFVEHEKELLNKNRKISRLTSKLEMVRQLTKNLFKDDDSDSETIIEEDRKPPLKSISTKQISDQNSSYNQRKISNFFVSACHSSTKLEFSTQESNNPEATPAVGMNSNSEFTENEVDREEIEDENLLVPLQSPSCEFPSKKVCNECDRKFTSLISFKRHKLLHTGLLQQKYRSGEQLQPNRTHTEEMSFTCSECPKTFKDQHTLNRHMVIHSDERPFSCPTCSLAFRRSDHLKSHVKRIHNNGASTFPCTMCPKTFQHLRSLIFHKKKQHKKKQTKKNGIKNISCDECDVKFSWPNNLKRHKNNVHSQT